MPLYTDTKRQKTGASQSEEPTLRLSVGGYQVYDVAIRSGNRFALTVHGGLCQKKVELVRKGLSGVGAVSVLDLGASNGAVSLACLQDATGMRITSVDTDPDQLAVMNRVRLALTPDLEQHDTAWTVMAGRFGTVSLQPHDVVLCLSLVHWIYSATDEFGSLDAIVQRLAGLTDKVCLLEWVPPEDPAIACLRHTSMNPTVTTEPYTTENFMTAIRRHFAETESLGFTNATRQLWKLTGPLVSVPPCAHETTD